MSQAPSRRVAFQGEPGAYSHLACREFAPELEPLPCPTFEDALSSVGQNRAALALLPVENSFAGRVTDAHMMLPDSGLHIVGEHFLRIRHQLMAKRGTALTELRSARSHVQALDQCRSTLRELGLAKDVHGDTAGAARSVAGDESRSVAAVASTLAAEIYGLEILRADVEDDPRNTTRFLALSRTPQWPEADEKAVITTLLFEVRNVPAALYKALGGFATNGVNLTKIESYQEAGSFRATAFYVDFEGHPDQDEVQHAMSELEHFTSRLDVLGVYRAAASRSWSPGRGR